MKLVKMKDSNMTIIEHDKFIILFSYETPVAGWDRHGAFKTNKYFSKTTTRHINKYFSEYCFAEDSEVREVPQEWIEQSIKWNNRIGSGVFV